MGCLLIGTPGSDEQQVDDCKVPLVCGRERDQATVRLDEVASLSKLSAVQCRTDPAIWVTRPFAISTSNISSEAPMTPTERWVATSKISVPSSLFFHGAT